MDEVLLIRILAFIAGWLIASTSGWLLRPSYERNMPFNWRILLGVKYFYKKWLYNNYYSKG